MDIKAAAGEARTLTKNAITAGTITLPEGVRWSIRQNKTYDGLQLVLRGLDRATFFKTREQLEREGTNRRQLAEDGQALVVALTELFADIGRQAADYDPYADYQDNGWGRVTIHAVMDGEAYGRDVSPNWP